LLDEGCGSLDALGLHEAIGRLGAQVETEVGSDATLVGITTLERTAVDAMALVADLVARPTLGAKDFDRVRDLRRNRLLQMRDVPAAVAERVFVERLYGSHPYGHLPIGSELSLLAMDVADVQRFHERFYVPSRVTVIAVGAGSHEGLASLVEGAFGGWRVDSPADSLGDPALAPPPRASSQVVVVPRPEAPQSELRIGHVAVARSSPDYHALLALNLVLGGQFVSRINSNLRERNGYTYGARTSFEFRRGPGPFALHASVQSDRTAEAIAEALDEIQAIRADRPVTDAELELGRAPLTRGYPRGFETAEQVGRAAAQLALYDLPDDYFSTFVPKILALTADDLTRVAAMHIDPKRLTTVIVGDPQMIGGVTELGLGSPSIVEATA
jgi:predicted Zn-dependent peptidase